MKCSPYSSARGALSSIVRRAMMNPYVINVFSAAVSAAVLAGTAHLLAKTPEASSPDAVMTLAWFSSRAIPVAAISWFVIAALLGAVVVRFRLSAPLVFLSLGVCITCGIGWWIARGAAVISTEELLFGVLIAALLTWVPIGVFWLGVWGALRAV